MADTSRAMPDGEEKTGRVPTLPVNAEEPDSEILARAVALLEAGVLLIYPTDTFYALGGHGLRAEVGRKVRRAKGRDESKPLPLVVADQLQAMSLCSSWPDMAARLAAAFWPGPLTMVLPALPDVPPEVTSGTNTVAVRVPRCELARRLCARVAPLIATSANRSGDAPPVSCAQAVAGVGFSAALALDGGSGRSVPSSVLDLTRSPAVLLRAGAIPWEDIVRVLL